MAFTIRRLLGVAGEELFYTVPMMRCLSGRCIETSARRRQGVELATENRVERCLRDARRWTMPDETPQIQKLILGRALTGLSAVR